MYEEAQEIWEAPRTLKHSLPIPWVLEQEGLRLELQGSQLVSRCPFHADSDPSFSVHFEPDRGWRWGCWPCGLSGDVVDLMQELYGISFTDAVAAGRRGVLKIAATGWRAPALEASGVFDSAGGRQLLTAARVQDAIPQVRDFISAKGLPMPAEWLCMAWDICALNGQLIVPIYDRNRELVGIKHRRVDGSDHLFALPGSALGDVLYGEDRLGPAGPNYPVILCEGESDAWMASWLARDLRYLVLSVATGAGSHVRPAARLAGREVHVIFDGDEAGRLGGGRWEDELRRNGCDVTRWVLPEGEDICSYGNLGFLKKDPR